MADGDFALPVGHVSTGVSMLNMCIGRPFRQPVDIPAENANYSKGLELWLSDSDPDRNLYAVFHGEIQYLGAFPDQANRITLRVKSSAQTKFNKMIENRTNAGVTYPGLIEPIPTQVIYVNLDFNLSQARLFGYGFYKTVLK